MKKKIKLLKLKRKCFWKKNGIKKGRYLKSSRRNCKKKIMQEVKCLSFNANGYTRNVRICCCCHSSPRTPPHYLNPVLSHAAYCTTWFLFYFFGFSPCVAFVQRALTPLCLIMMLLIPVLLLLVMLLMVMMLVSGWWLCCCCCCCAIADY